MALKKSQWTPQPGDNRNDPAKFITYLDILSKAPCMEVIGVSDQSVSCRESNYNELIKKAADLLEQGIEGEVDVERIVDSLTTLAQGLSVVCGPVTGSGRRITACRAAPARSG